MSGIHPSFSLQPLQEAVPVSDIGSVSSPPPTFLERWGVVFVSVSGLWLLGSSIALLWYYLAHLSAPPLQAGTMKAEDYKVMLDLHRIAADQFRDSLSFAFDLMITKTVLPLLTLLLGYLFGAKKS